MKIVLYSLLCLYISLNYVASQSSASSEPATNQCTGAKTCGECIRRSPECAWCGADSYPKGQSRCDIKVLLKNCSDSDISHPKSEKSVAQDNDFTNGDDEKEQPVQVKPQKINFNVRPNDKQTFQLNFRQQPNYPVDLYFLLDNSYSINREEAKENLKKLGSGMRMSIKDITKNFRLGYGTFVDKTTFPYSAWTPTMAKSRCPIKTGSGCSDPYVFKNEAALGVGDVEFGSLLEESLKTQSVSMDDTEAGLEALIQAVDCDSQIDWQRNARRIVVYCSNSKFHYSGAGKLGGATKMGQMSCGLGDSKIYNNVENDYPTVSQIASKLSEKKTNVIFAVAENVVSDYELLASAGLGQGVKVGPLSNDSGNIVQLIRTAYDELRSSIVFKPKDDDDIKFVFKSSCLGGKSELTNECANLKVGDSVKFDVEMTVEPDICVDENGKNREGNLKKTVSIEAVGLNEALEINLDIMCECQCESDKDEIKNSPKCSGGNGTLECGVCSCNPGRYGRVCECDETQISSEESNKQCRKGNSTDICTNQGECICGTCQCLPISSGDPDRRYSGQFCECNDYVCELGSNGLLCGGPLQGTCKCGNCQCLPGWKGSNCDCTLSQETCKAANNITCNGMGDCECGKCTCGINPKTGKQMTGPTCEDCEGCNVRCEEYTPCAQCIGFGTGEYDVNECDKECKVSTKAVDTLSSGAGIRQCQDKDVDGCFFKFTYQYSKSNDVIIRVQKTKECPEEAPLAAMVGGIVAAVVLIPLLLILLFIFCRNRRDAKEFAEFMKEREKARWESGANPIYKDPKSTFQNPTYKGAA